MNTVAKGDAFEEQCYELIKQALSKGELGLMQEHVQIIRKAGYYSERRKGQIIFDLAIQVWPPGATRASVH
jgi:hypothetical protein